MKIVTCLKCYDTGYKPISNYSFTGRWNIGMFKRLELEVVIKKKRFLVFPYRMKIWVNDEDFIEVYECDTSTKLGATHGGPG